MPPAPKDNTAKKTRILIGSNGNVTVNLTSLNTTSFVEKGAGSAPSSSASRTTAAPP
ncbi:hypothetical protein [Streptomyces europaeiscabiei]|uniref:hypothetical protein n=1 Tax=Streptomyces europaeiscabiei TaxID=146819 RepID=UPI002E2A6126|nr:hypothetical protein [Streptomyces europaeiscabiei]